MSFLLKRSARPVWPAFPGCGHRSFAQTKKPAQPRLRRSQLPNPHQIKRSGQQRRKVLSALSGPDSKRLDQGLRKDPAANKEIANTTLISARKRQAPVLALASTISKATIPASSACCAGWPHVAPASGFPSTRRNARGSFEIASRTDVSLKPSQGSDDRSAQERVIMNVAVKIRRTIK